MKILLISFNWVEYLIEMANALTSRGHQCEVVFKTSRVLETVGNELHNLLDSRVRYHLIDDRPGGFRDPKQLMAVVRLVEAIRKSSPDVINIHEATNTYLPFCFTLFRKIPLVLTIHDVSTHPGADSQQPARRIRVRSFLRNRATAVILHGEWLRERYVALPGDHCRKAFSIPHGCYTVLRHWARKDVNEIPDSVLFFGRLHEYKGLEYLLRAAEIVAREFPAFKVIIAGDGSEIESRYEELLNNPYCIVHKGYLPNERVAEVFQQAAIVVLPYIEGSQSGVVRVAYVFRKPVIVTSVGSIPESVRDNVTGIVIPPRDEFALASAIKELLTDNQRRLAMGAAGGDMIDKDLSWANIARRAESVFQDAARSS
jgi:glycosyltransferase involved in cell wall biosynthesis